MNKKVKNILDSNIYTHNNYINTSTNNITTRTTTITNDELKSIQRSIALLRQDLPKIIYDELVRSKIT